MTMTKKFALPLLAGLIGGAAALPALAGGYIEPAPAPVVVQPEPVLSYGNWAGGYVGANVGWNDDKADPDFGATGSMTANGESFGLGAGYNWQSGAWVYGVEGDISTADISDSETSGGDEFESKIDTMATLRGRVGYDMGNWMPYVTAGVAAAKADYSFENAAGRSSDSDTLTGYTAGFGAEYKINDKWSAKGEYLYTKFDGRFEGEGDVDHDVNSLRLGMNYHF
ncbi:outer membrane protein [Frigidibacter sp. MR17.14]|uniref:outer membrane protein n=1 Tax=Frigidibacter sp. MR17.14 TaxID=3126509 RepID=UPI003012C110